MKELKKYHYIFFAAVLWSVSASIVYAVTPTLLEPIGGFIAAGDNTLGAYFAGFFRLILAAAGVLAVLMLVTCGMRYIASVIPSAKEGAKTCITNALGGLLLALGGWAILATINTDFIMGTF